MNLKSVAKIDGVLNWISCKSKRCDDVEYCAMQGACLPHKVRTGCENDGNAHHAHFIQCMNKLLFKHIRNLFNG